MANGTIDFFTSSAPAFTGWTYQLPGGSRVDRGYVNELGADGDEIARATSNPKEESSWTYLLADSVTTGAIPIPNVGQVTATGGWHVDRVQISWDRGQMRPKMTASAHRHAAGNAHTEGSCRQYAASVAINVTTFGVPADLGGVKLAQNAVVDWRDATYTLECNHVDEAGRNGNQLAGDNYDGTETISVNITGNWTSDDLVVTAGWTRVSDGKTPSNIGATAGSAEFVHHVAHVTPPAQTASLASPRSDASSPDLTGAEAGTPSAESGIA